MRILDPVIAGQCVIILRRRLAVVSAADDGKRIRTGNDHSGPLGDLAGVMALLIQGSPLVDFTLERATPKGSYKFSTLEVREQLGPDVPLDEPEVFLWLNDYLQELEAEV